MFWGRRAPPSTRRDDTARRLGNTAPMSEFAWIARHFAPLAAAAPGALGLADDAALLPGGLVVSCDTALEGVHWPPGLPPRAVARRALRCALSDLAAMGARPVGCLIALSLPADTSEAWVAAFAAGLGRDLAALRTPLLGGDTTRTPGPPAVTVTVLGDMGGAAPLTRAGAQAGDALYLSGPVGGAAAGLDALRADPGAGGPAAEAFLTPEPQIALGIAARGVARAAVDVSDGLVADVGHLARASGLAATLRAPDIPVHPGVALARAITAGDDYALVLALPPGARVPGFGLHRIGILEPGPPGRVAVLGADGEPIALPAGGWAHF
jgi:thiamine-monophosphate kinase